MKYLQLIIFSSLMFTACAVPAPTAVAQDNDFTLGKVQSQLKEGMSSSQVVSLLRFAKFSYKHKRWWRSMDI
jgi:hypothetical protein